jgi:hypothetical protein
VLQLLDSATKPHADAFLAEAIARLRCIPLSALDKWPDWPEKPLFDLAPPAELSKYTFTLMKDRLPDGDIRIAIQRYRPFLLGVVGEMAVEGFRISAEGALTPLTQRDIWDLT